MRAQILFVDDEPCVLQGLQRSTHAMRDEWEMTFLDNSETALRFLEKSPVAVVVSDMRMPGMNGAQFLARVCEISADTVRVMLTGNADYQTAIDAVNQGHVFQFLLKPCEGKRLVQGLQAAVRQHQLQTTERELLRTQLEHTEKMRLIGQLAAGINHDLNNILTAIVAQTQLALLETPPALPPIAAMLMGRIQESALRATEMTRELNGFSRHETGAELQRLNLAEVVEAGVRIVQPMLRQQIKLRVELSPGLPAIQGNAGKLKQGIMNLVINARDAMPEGGEVHITARACRFTETDPAVNPKQRPGPYVCLSVRDTGCGMDAATQQRLFEPFFTTKATGKGTGLGLFMIGNILEQHQGWVEVESAVGGGTVFHLFLPQAPPSGGSSASSLLRFVHSC